MSFWHQNCTLIKGGVSDYNRCVRLEARLQTAINESRRLQSGAELKTDTSSRTLSALVSDAHAVFAYSITDEVNKMQ